MQRGGVRFAAACHTDPPLHKARRILSAIADAARPQQPTHTKTSGTATWSETTDPKARLREYGEAQEQHIRRQIGKLCAQIRLFL